MSGTIGITCTVQSAVKKKELYFKAIDVLETTYSSVKLSYLTNLDKPVNSVNTRNIEKTEPRVPEIGLGIDVGGLNFSNTSDFTPDVELIGDTIIINSIDGWHGGTDASGTTTNKIVLTSNCNGYFYFNGTIKTGNTVSITIKSGAKIIFANSGKINEGCSDSNISLEIEEGAVVHFENRGSIYGQIKTNNNSVIITKNEADFNRMKKNNKGLLITTEKYFKYISDLFNFETTQNSIIINKQIMIEHDDGMDSYCPSLIINKDCNIICNGIFMQDHYANTPESNSSQQMEPGVSESYFENNGTLTIMPGSELYLYGRTANHKNNGVIYNLGNIKGQEKVTGTGKIISLDITAEVNGELYNDITVDKTNRTVTIDSLTPETDYDINLIASLEPYIGRSRTIKQRTIKAPPATLMAGEQFRETLEGMSGFEYVTAIRFEQKSGTLSGIDVSEAKDGRIKSRISGSILYVEANGEIFANSDCSTMFGTFGYPDFGVNGILNEITFNNFNTSKVTTMKAMFYSCKLLTNLDVSNFDTSNVTNMYEMFYDCGSLISIKGLENFNTSKVEDMSYMFDSCYYLNGEITIMNPNITNYTDMFDSCTSKDGRFIINYTQGCKGIAENMIATFSSGPIIPFNGLVLGTEINILNYMVKK